MGSAPKRSAAARQGAGFLGGGAWEAGDRSSAILAPEERVADYVGERSGGDLEDGFGEFSFGRMIRSVVTGDRRELNDRELRAMSEGSDPAGGFLLAPALSSVIIDLARANAVAFTAGAQTVVMEQPTVYLARMASGSTASFKLENDPVIGSDQVWERVELNAKTIVVRQLMSRELYEDLSPEADRVIRNEIAQAIALKLDLAVFEGSGVSPEPRGLVNTTGLNSISMGTNGATPSGFDEIVKADYAARRNNAGPATAAVMNPREGESYALFKDNMGQPLRRPPEITTLPFLTTSQLSTTRTQGNRSDAANIYVGRMDEILVGVRPSLQLRFQLLTERYADNLQVAMLAWLRCDVAVGHPNWLTKIVGVLPIVA